MQKNMLFALCLILLGMGSAQAQKQYQLASPDGKLTLTVEAGETLTWAINHDGTTVIQPSALAIEGQDVKSPKRTVSFGKNVKVSKATRTSVNTSFATPFYKKSEVKDAYNQLVLKCNGYSVEFRAYDDGAAYRFVNATTRPFYIMNETVDFNFDKDYEAFVPYVNDNRNKERYCYSFESFYDEAPLSKMFADSLAITPLMVKLDGGKKATLLDAGVEDYPGLFLKHNPKNAKGLIAEFAFYPVEEFIGGHARLNVVPGKRADHIALIEGKRAFPWRAVVVTTKDTQLADNDMAQRLAPANRIADTSWIKPGKVSWDWWNTCNLIGVDFEAGMNTPTYKAYIDFAAENGLEYIIIDDGWSGTESLLRNLNPNIDLKAIIAHGNEKGVGVILWSSFRNLIWNSEGDKVDDIMSHYAGMGVKGFKVDFLDRDDQKISKASYELAAAAARHNLLLDIHGMKPNGIQRAYPNIMNFEGVKGLENHKWEQIVRGRPLHDFPRYDVTAPYLRMLIGPMDYTPGAMTNARRDMFRTINDHPMSQGTRVHQMAMYTIYEAPLQMLADGPSNYRKEQECTDFIAKVPTVFDETVALDGEVGEYITLARRKGDTWFVGSMTNWTARTVTIDCSFLGDGTYEMEIFADGVNAHRNAMDYKKTVRTVTKNDKLTVKLAPGGGWTARIYTR